MVTKKSVAKMGKEQGKQLAQVFKEIGRNVEDEVEKALSIGALRVEKDAKRKCAVDTGRLRASISQRFVDISDNVKGVEVGTNVEYARDQEFGSSHNKPHPFLYPSLLENKSKILQDIAKAFRMGAGL